MLPFHWRIGVELIVSVIVATKINVNNLYKAAVFSWISLFIIETAHFINFLLEFLVKICLPFLPFFNLHFSYVILFVRCWLGSVFIAFFTLFFAQTYYHLTNFMASDRVHWSPFRFRVRSSPLIFSNFIIDFCVLCL